MLQAPEGYSRQRIPLLESYNGFPRPFAFLLNRATLPGDAIVTGLVFARVEALPSILGPTRSPQEIIEQTNR